jgi:o-succinylbenzoate synthase
MKHAPLVLYRYAIPFRKPFSTAAGNIVKREGFLLGDGQGIWTEMAPLPGFSVESLEETGAFLTEHRERIRSDFQNHSLDQLLEDPSLQPLLTRLPSVRFGLSMLSEQQKAMAADLPLYGYWKNLLFPKTARNLVSPVEGYVRCNALVGILEPEKREQVLRFRKECGFRVVKVKIPANPDEAFKVMRDTCRAFPDMMFRFDANRSFSPDQCSSLFQRLQEEQKMDGWPRNIAYVEEPLAEPDPETISALQPYGIPLAFDESVRSPGDVRALESHAAIKHVVIKPMLFGSLQELKSAMRSRLTVVISSTFETAVGRRLLAHLAFVCSMKRETDHGLDTGSMLQDDFSPRESGPHIHLGNKFGLGIAVKASHGWLERVPKF